ncbi:M24 family metallopeptidase [Halobellus limi]|uniref:Aminopeptidase P family protein n=1 Tax=Halobellus limi TaxID=699433 RepID=A0A1H5ZBJ8_9EURY|nr:Xaa-Pro peptidase family protein [Halobellus limi]QCC48152.1 aminopeptidase P family protein [Halobellus limi]SEG33681.1 Xaa-Pro aminopeptidase [Halobellus limi]
MDPDLSPLDEYLDEGGLDGYLVDADSSESTQRYLSGFDAPDPFVTLYTPETTALLVSALEYGRANRQSRADDVSRLADYDYRSLAGEHGPRAAKARVVAAWLDDRGVDSVATPERFPLGPADRLRERGVSVAPETEDVVTEVRARKTDEEIEHVRAAQRANEAAMDAAADLLREAEVVEAGGAKGGAGNERDGAGESDAGDRALAVDGDVLTSERVREEIEVTLLRHGCALDETIVACGSDAADPHDRGSGPLRPDEPIIVDIFPRSKETKYHADMTRTFVKGEPTDTIREWFDLTHEALVAAVDAIEPGVTGAAVHDIVCDVYEDAGLPTLRSDPKSETGFIHSTGHGVGLDVHELPRLSPDGDELQPGHVVTVEPGLYDPEVGGVRIEDLVVVTEDGSENLTNQPIELQI